MLINAFFLAICAAVVSAQTPEGFEPATENTLAVSFGTLTVTPGLDIPSNTTQSAPTVSTAPRSLIVMVDIDAPYPNNASLSPLLHWITDTPAEANSTIPYANPNPPPDSPAHRYVLLSYALPEGTGFNATFEMPTGFEQIATGDVRNRLHFDLEGFANAAGLEGPKGANWFMIAAANATSGGNGTTTPTVPPAEEYESTAGKSAVAAGVFGAAVAGVVAMML